MFREGITQSKRENLQIPKGGGGLKKKNPNLNFGNLCNLGQGGLDYFFYVYCLEIRCALPNLEENLNINWFYMSKWKLN